MNDKPISEGWLDMKSAARRLGVTPQALHALCNRGTLASRYIGGRRFVRASALLDLVQRPEYEKATRARNGRKIAELNGQFVAFEDGEIS